MLKNVEMGANFYKELGKLEKQLAKYQSKVLEIKTQMKEHLTNTKNIDKYN
ncbi:hypothetical protein [Helicobacter pylori]|uniref:hypothetical protein n=1 Tax=Helicobacter pylori TaxID=210 RepID=UPI0013CDFD39|nr:hypothetical protein [Helicobacter pylori]